MPDTAPTEAAQQSRCSRRRTPPTGRPALLSWFRFLRPNVDRAGGSRQMAESRGELAASNGQKAAGWEPKTGGALRAQEPGEFGLRT